LQLRHTKTKAPHVLLMSGNQSKKKINPKTEEVR
jgi:hypothetical protein